MKKISIDFDGTLEYLDVQQLAQKLIDLGHEVQIVTTRWDEDNKWRYAFYNGLSRELKDSLHSDLYQVAEKLKIPVYFTNMEYKADFLKKKKVDVHIDDNWEEIMFCRRNGIKAYKVSPDRIDRKPIDVEQALENILD